MPTFCMAREKAAESMLLWPHPQPQILAVVQCITAGMRESLLPGCVLNLLNLWRPFMAESRAPIPRRGPPRSCQEPEPVVGFS